MPRLKLIQSGFTTLTGPLHDVLFTNGLSGVVSDRDIKRVSANIAADLYQDDGTTRIGPAGEASDMVGKVTRPAPIDPITRQPMFVTGEGGDAGLNCFKNFKPSNTRRIRRGIANVLAGVADFRLGIIGDSTDAGSGSAGAAVRAAAPARTFARQLNRRLAPTQEVAIMGSAGLTDWTVYDNRLTLGAGWAFTSSGIAGGYLRNSTTVNALTFNPGVTFDRIAVFYNVAAGGSATGFTVDIGGAVLATLNTLGANELASTIINCARGANTINIKRVAGQNDICGIAVWDSTTKQIDIWNLGRAGETSVTNVLATNPWSPGNSQLDLGLEAAFVALGINDWLTGISADAFEANLRTKITSLKDACDLILVTAKPTSDAIVPVATQMVYVEKVRALAEEFDLPLVDARRYWESREVNVDLFADNTHQTALGTAYQGMLYAAAIEFAVGLG